MQSRLLQFWEFACFHGKVIISVAQTYPSNIKSTYLTSHTKAISVTGNCIISLCYLICYIKKKKISIFYYANYLIPLVPQSNVFIDFFQVEEICPHNSRGHSNFFLLILGGKVYCFIITNYSALSCRRIIHLLCVVMETVGTSLGGVTSLAQWYHSACVTCFHQWNVGEITHAISKVLSHVWFNHVNFLLQWQRYLPEKGCCFSLGSGMKNVCGAESQLMCNYHSLNMK